MPQKPHSKPHAVKITQYRIKFEFVFCMLHLIEISLIFTIVGYPDKTLEKPEYISPPWD